MAKKKAKRRRSSWRKGFSEDQYLQRVRPAESFEYLANPHKGTTTFQRFNGDEPYPGVRTSDRWGPLEFKPFKGDPARLVNRSYPKTTVSYCRWPWDLIEPVKGRIRWDVFDGALRSARERGQTLQVRLQPWTGGPFPDWFWKKGIKGKARGTQFLEPDYNDPAYLRHWGDLIRAFAKRYDGHSDLESFDVAYAGQFGEMGGNCTYKGAAKLVDVYLKSFRKTQLVSMLGTHGCRYAARTAGGKVGWRADCYGDLRSSGRGVVPDGLNWNHMHDAYPKEIFEDGVSEAWKTSPVTLETCGNVGTWWRGGYDIDWIMEQGYKYHLSVFMPKSVRFPAQWAKKFDEFNRRIGYRFVPRHVMLPMEAKAGRAFKFEIWIDNAGVAPIYRPYVPAFRFRQGRNVKVVPLKADIRKWMPGHTWVSDAFRFPKGLKAGEAKIDLGIVADKKGSDAVVRFAAEGNMPDGWLRLRSVDVV